MPGMPSTGRTLRSTINSDGSLQLRMAEEQVADPTGSQVLVSVEASPINPSDLGVLLGPADPATLAPVEGGGLDGNVDERIIPILRDRLDKALQKGRLVVSVDVNDDDDDAARVAVILEEHGGHDMWRLGEWSFNRVGPEGSGEG